MDFIHVQEELENDPKMLNDLHELKDIPINVWSRDQEDLEKQALTEIEIFNSTKEDGELSDQELEQEQPLERTNLYVLDIEKYIAKQNELKKQLEFKRATSISDKSKSAASKVPDVNKIHKRKLDRKNIKAKRKKLEIATSTKTNDENSGSEYLPSEGDDEDSDYIPVQRDTSTEKEKLKKYSITFSVKKNVTDDGDIKYYKRRLNAYYKSLEICNGNNIDHIEVCSGFKISSKVWTNLYSYQQDAVEWLYRLHSNSTGALLGDEMGLGKTVQVIAFLHGVSYSRNISRYCRYTGLGPTIIVCPTTVIHQWVQHFYEWAPEFRVAVLHQSGSYTGNKLTLIKDIYKDKGIIVTSYLGILKYKNALTDLDWHYVVLDEGHKIRNPTSKITIAVKQFRTPHKLMLTGSPMQNNLQELWSLFDFICPSMLGSLPVFMEHFAVPIMQGGYSNATPIQETTAYLMATSLKSMISPYLLRRSKDEVRSDICLPQKSEQVLFCSLTDEQYDLYKGFLMSENMSSVLNKSGKNWFSQGYIRANVLVAITTLRKICNHPDLYSQDTDEEKSHDIPIEESFGYYKRSGKMIVVAALLKIWKKQKHRVLLFTQGRAMVSVFEHFLAQQEYKYLKMDGSTNIKSRQNIITTFNQDASYDVFLLTTRVGGLGINLTGANRVIIYDPDWNPATDLQARERAWRIGQERQVTIYRLVSAGTIEEKMYQRQVWKQLLSNKVLLDPKTQKFFKTSDLHDLFSIQDRQSSNSETANIFKNSRICMEERLKEKEALKKKKRKTALSEGTVNFSDDKIEQMKKLAQEIAKSIGKTDNTSLESKKSSFELEMEEERERKAREKEYMKTLTPTELRKYNKKKLLPVDDSMINKIDDIETEASFSKVLEISEKTSDIYTKIKDDKIDIDKAQCSYVSLTQSIKKKEDKVKSKKIKRKDKNTDKTVIDHSGKVDGEKVDFLLKTEVKLKKEKMKKKCESQDQYVLEKLFSKKGVHTALEHDTIVDCKKTDRPNRFRLHTDAEARTELALQALRKSRLNNWRW